MNYHAEFQGKILKNMDFIKYLVSYVFFGPRCISKNSKNTLFLTIEPRNDINYTHTSNISSSILAGGGEEDNTGIARHITSGNVVAQSQMGDGEAPQGNELIMRILTPSCTDRTPT